MSGRARRLSDDDEIEQAKTALTTRIPSIKLFMDQTSIEFYELQPERRVLINFAWGVNWKLEVDG